MTWSARRIFIKPTSATTGDPLRPFTFADLSGAEAAYFSPGAATKLSQFDALVPDVSAPGEVTAENLVNFLRGDRSLERDGEVSHGQIWRKRIDVLGDIVNTTPVFMTAPNQEPILMYTDGGYDAFKTGAAASRTPVVFSAANDGMLHAINAHTAAVTVSGATVLPGEEMWAYVPQQVMTSMKILADATYSHRYFIDGPILVSDVNFGGGDSDWHTILIAGQGGGGKSYFALDVTNPLTPKFLWEFTDNGLGYTFGNPMVSKLHNGEWSVFFTSGYNNADGLGYLYALNPKTGALKTGYPLSTGSGTGGSPSNLGKLALWKDNPSVDNTAQYAYAGDLNGDLWRFDLDPTGSGHTTVPVFKLAHLEANGVPQPITTAPEATSSGSYRVVYVGTGKYLENNQPSPPGVSDLTNTDVQSIYMIKDALLAAQTTANPQTDTMVVGADTVPVFLKRTLIAQMDDGTPITTTENLVTSETRKICNGPYTTAYSAPTISHVTGACAGETGPAMDLDTYGGWYVNLPDPGERVNINPLLIGGTLSLASNVPNATSCTVGGYSYTTNLDFLTGLGVGQKTVTSNVTVTKLDGTTAIVSVAVSQGVPPVASVKHTKLVVGITPVWIDGVLYNLIAYADGTFLLEKIPLATTTCPGCTANGAFGNKRSLWREFEAYQ
jgi:type IV pilus assembly protein PilY1